NRTIFLLGVVIVFTLLSYNQPSVVRASIMATLVLLGKAFQRKIDLNNIIATTALIILLIKPTEFFDVGFQLSFTTAWGLIFLTPKITKLLEPIQSRRYYKFLIFPFIISLVAQIVALPMSAYYFHRLPMIAFVSNILIVPLVSIIVIGEVTILLATFLLPVFGSFVGSLVEPFLQLTIFLLQYFGSEKIAMVQAFQITSIQLVAYYVILILLVYSMRLKKSRRLLIIAILVFSNMVVFGQLFSEKYDYKFTIFSSSGGVVALAETDKTQLILGDLPSKKYNITDKTVVPYLANRNIDKYSIIALSNDYPTIKEVLFLLKRNGFVNALIPASSRNLSLDLIADKFTEVSKSQIEYYEELVWPVRIKTDRLFLDHNLLNYRFDSVSVIFLSRTNKPSHACRLIQNIHPQKIIVKDLIDKSDFLSILESMDIKAKLTENVKSTHYLICQRLTKSAQEEIRQNYSYISEYVKIIELSQVGAVELFIRNGQLYHIKCGNYNIF
ncbi:MAG: ComEC/Rec2 family competence protein, partial [candidate division Zixibacteria bacterium]|nr:ComEC/Rec2 family competence protein [candidate division Zixibacteria bacterium]